MTRRPLTKWEIRLGKTDSPIEEMFLTAFCDAAETRGYRIDKTPRANDTIAVRPQQRVGNYRADFSVGFRFFGAETAIIVECDGHDFHEKTKYQASRDKARDRYFTKQEYKTMRFTGSDLNRSASACAEEVLSLIMDFQTTRIELASRQREKHIVPDAAE